MPAAAAAAVEGKEGCDVMLREWVVVREGGLWVLASCCLEAAAEDRAGSGSFCQSGWCAIEMSERRLWGTGQQQRGVTFSGVRMGVGWEMSARRHGGVLAALCLQQQQQQRVRTSSEMSARRHGGVLAALCH